MGYQPLTKGACRLLQVTAGYWGAGQLVPGVRACVPAVADALSTFQ